MRILGRWTNKISAISALVAGLALVGMGSPASAQVTSGTFILDQKDPGSTLPAGPYGQVDVVQTSTTDLTITYTLYAGFRIHESKNSNHYAFYFDTTTAIDPLKMNLPNGFSLISTGGPFTPTGWGTSLVYGYAISCDSGGAACGSGYGGGYAKPLTFDLVSAGGKTPMTLYAPPIDPTNPGNGCLIFAGDVVASNGSTGNIAAAGASCH